MNKKVCLLILDGWGIGDGTKSDAIANANVPFYKSLLEKYPHGKLKASGLDVGLPAGQMGNSEVGHLNIGAGRVVYQDIAKINKEIETKNIDKNKELNDSFKYAKDNKKALHFIGLVSDGGVHSLQDHLHYLCDLANKAGVEKIFIHAFTDGRDCDPKSGKGFIEKLEEHIKNTNAKLATVIGRYYAMDRDKRWARVKMAYDLLVNNIGEKNTDAGKAIQKSYDEGVTDEFIKPIVITDNNNQPIAKIAEGDAVICFNYRTDRCREITEVLTQENFEEFGMHTLPLHYATLTNYDASFKNVHVMYDKDNLANTLGEVLSKNNKKQIRIAETEKYPHVTFFFSGGREEPFPGESRILIPSAKVATYDLQPEMSANEIADAICKELIKEEVDYVCLNFANPDMVGHSGVYSAVVKAVETVDACNKKVVETGLAHGYSFIIIADHGNADYMINEDGTPHTSHSLNLVPCIVIDKDVKEVKDGRLADVAPTILKIMNIPQPKEMDGVALI